MLRHAWRWRLYRMHRTCLAHNAGAGSQSGEKEQAKTQALHAAAQGLLGLQLRVGLPDAAPLATAIAQIGTVILERSPEEFAKHSPQVTLAHVQMGCPCVTKPDAPPLCIICAGRAADPAHCDMSGSAGDGRGGDRSRVL